MRSLSRETRPKSIATVVVVLFGVWDRSSTPALASVMTASVVSGSISETAPTSVVLPTPKPPAMTIFADVVAALESTQAVGLEVSKSIQHPLHQGEIRSIGWGVALVHPHESLLRHVTHQHPRHAERHPQVGGDLRYRACPPAEVADELPLRRGRLRRAVAEPGRRDECLDRQLVVRPGPPAGDRVRPDQRTVLGRVAAHRGALSRQLSSSRKDGLQ